MIQLILAYRNFFRTAKAFTVYVYYVELEEPMILSYSSYAKNLYDYSADYQRRAIIEHLISHGCYDFGESVKILKGDNLVNEYEKCMRIVNEYTNRNQFTPDILCEKKDNYSTVCSYSAATPIKELFTQVLRNDKIERLVYE